MYEQQLNLTGHHPIMENATLRYGCWGGAPWTDVHALSNGSVAIALLDDVVDPALATLDANLHRLRTSDNALDSFSISDAESLLFATTTAFCLSLQSIWERQLRSYLARCANEMKVKSEIAVKAQANAWEEVIALFMTLRGHPLDQFEASEDLALLHLVGNVCRHGDGKSLNLLTKDHPELWPVPSEILFPVPGGTSYQTPSAATLRIQPAMLHRFITAIASFWDEVQYLYNEGIDHKHPQLEKQLLVERIQRATRLQKRNLVSWFIT